MFLAHLVENLKDSSHAGKQIGAYENHQNVLFKGVYLFFLQS